MRPTVGFISLGCPKNLVDSERMMGLLSKDGIILTGDQSKADIVVINTCGFLEPAKMESLGTIDEFVALKKKKKLKGVVVTGCMTERYLGLMKEKFPQVDAFLQTKEFSKITEVVNEIAQGESEKLKARLQLLGEEDQLHGHSELTDFVERAAGRRSYAYVKIAEGCNRTCTFCIIPKLRGKLHSRSVEGVVDEVRQLVEQGTQEVIFIAQDLTSYGRDLGDGTSLLKLLRGVEDIEGLRWYRLMYNYPRFFTEELIDFLAQSKNFSGYVDIPFQHISDSVLKAMKRPESKSEIYNLVKSLREKIPHLSLRTTVMVGFPGETEEDFQQLLDFIREMQFDHLGAFTYWREEGTPSHDFPDQILEDVKKDRYHRLMTLQQSIQKKRLERHLGRTLAMVIDGFTEKTKQGLVYQGRHAGQAPDIDGVTYIVSERELQIGQIVDVEVGKIIGDYDLLGAEVVVHAEVAQLVEQRIRNA
jgi:ribosomal protein S12 methylthiotransferase